MEENRVTDSQAREVPHQNSMIGAFNKDDYLVMRRAPNEGWIVSVWDWNRPHNERTIGAYGSAEAMLGALTNALVRVSTETDANDV